MRAYPGILLLSIGLIPSVSVAQVSDPWLPVGTQLIVEQSITDAALAGHTRFLSDDLLGGRGPGSTGDQLAQRYIATQFEALGLRPAAPDGGWYQPVPLVGVKSHPPTSITLSKGERQLQLTRQDDFVFVSGKPQPEVEVDQAELVFVGYGIVAPEYEWNDFKDLDVRGKVLVVMNNDPADDPKLFAGRRRLYYGRWDYKYAVAARQGAAGAIIIHTTESAGYPYQVVQTSWSGEEFELRNVNKPRVDIKGWFTEEAATRVFELAGHSLEDLRRKAESRDFQPVPLGVSLSTKIQCNVRDRETANVVARLDSEDSELGKECVLFMAHHDHIGTAEEPDSTGDRIYNGAVDNASGSAALLTIAQAITRLPNRPDRSILFVAVGAEEQGLLGSEYFAAHPPVAPGYMAGVINIDGVNIFGRTRDVNVIGLGKSSMDDFVRRVAQMQRRVVTPDLFPDRGYYYRSDQFSLAKIGVPGVYLHGGVQVEGRPDNWGKDRKDAWVEEHYHQPSDEISEDWDLAGAVTDIRLLCYTGLLAADGKAPFPTWTVGDEFEAARLEAIRVRD